MPSTPDPKQRPGVSLRGFLRVIGTTAVAAAACSPLEALAGPPRVTPPGPAPTLTPLQSAFSVFLNTVHKARQVKGVVASEPRKVFTQNGQSSVSRVDVVTDKTKKKRTSEIGIALNRLTGLLQQDPHNREFKATLKNLTAEQSRLLAQAPYPALIELSQATFGDDATRVAQDVLLKLAQEHVTPVQNQATLAVSESLPKRLLRILGDSGATEEVQLAAKLLAHNFLFNVTETITERGKAIPKSVPYGLTVRMIVDNSTINGMDYTSRGTTVPSLVFSDQAVVAHDYAPIE